jgi:hypothetical protein
MQRMENRAVAVQYCDFCEKEMQYFNKCAICKKEMCNEDGGTKHAAYHVELYRYSDGERLNAHVCKGCSVTVFKFAIQALFNDMIGKAPVQKA